MRILGYSSDSAHQESTQKKVTFGKCCYCKIKLTAETRTKDHVIPKSKGGRYLKKCCWACNQEKADLMLADYIFKLWAQPKTPLTEIKIENAEILYLNMLKKLPK